MEEESNEFKDRRIADLNHQVFHNDQMAKERAISDKKYADKLVEKIVFGMVSFILLAVLSALVLLVVK